MNSIIPGTIEEPGLDTRKVGTLVTRRGATSIDFSDRVVHVAREINTEAGRPVAIAYRVDRTLGRCRESNHQLRLIVDALDDKHQFQRQSGEGRVE